MKKISILIAGLVACSTAPAQTSVDALRYSLTSLTGSARYISMGGAFGALGADMSSISTNPAGIAVYHKSEISLSPAFYAARTATDYFNGHTFDTRYNMNFGHAGMVFTYNLDKEEKRHGWKNWNFGIVYNRLDNYQTSTVMNGFNPYNSLLDYYVQTANSNGGTDPNNLDRYYEYQAYQTYLINPDSNNFYTSVIPGGGVTQRRSSTTRGARSETAFSFGGNYNHKLYLGLNIGIASLHYIDDALYEEVDSQDSIFDFRNFTLHEDLTTRGWGVNVKFGMIYKPDDMVRIGLAIHSPTWYTMHDDYINETRSYFDNGDAYVYTSPPGAFDYDLKTPFRAIGSLAFVLGQSGLISADYEFVDYTSAELDSYSYRFFEENDAIHRKYTASQNIRVGTEWNYGDMSFRGGYAWFGSPFASAVRDKNGDLSKQSYCLGIGFHDHGYFIDFGYVYSRSDYLYVPYVLDTDQSPVSVNQVQSHNFTMTLGVKF